MADWIPVSLMALALAGCEAGDRRPLLLQELCVTDFAGRPLCTVSGDAAISTGLTEDAPAIRFGPAGGRFETNLAAIPDVQEARWSLEALVESEGGNILLRDAIDWRGADGRCTNDVCPPTIGASSATVPPGQPGWVRVVDAQFGTSFATVPAGAVIAFEAADLVLYDLRTP